MVATFLVRLMIPLLTRFGISHLDIIVATHAIVCILQPFLVHSPLTSTSLLNGHLPTNGCFSVFHAMNPSSLSKLMLFAGAILTAPIPNDSPLLIPPDSSALLHRIKPGRPLDSAIDSDIRAKFLLTKCFFVSYLWIHI
jgi:hypothetical protein